MTIPKVKVFWPLTIDATNNKVDYRLAADVADRTATIASATYLSIDLFIVALKAAMDAVGGGVTFTITADDSTGVLTFVASGGTSFTLRFGSGVSGALQPYLLLGFFALNTASTGLTLTAPKQHGNGWYAPTAIQRDSRNVTEAANDVVTVTVAGQSKSISETRLTVRTVQFHFLDPAYTFIADEGTNDVGRAVENWWLYGRAKFRYWPDSTVEGTSEDYFFDGEVVSEFAPERQFAGKEVYRIGPWKMRKYQS